MTKRKYTEEECLEALKVAISELGGAPTQEEYNSLELRPSASVISTRVGSWKLALTQLGVEKETRHKTSREPCLSSIQNLADELGKEPSTDDYITSSYSPSLSMIYTLFGTWTKAKEEAGVIDNGEKSPEDEAENFFEAMEDAEYGKK